MRFLVRFSLAAALTLAAASSVSAQSFQFPSSSPILVSPGGKYLGKLNTNKFDPDSVSNQFGRYGSKFSSDSINNPFGTYGSRFSNQSANNPFATQAPVVVAPSWGYEPLATPCYIGCD